MKFYLSSKTLINNILFMQDTNTFELINLLFSQFLWNKNFLLTVFKICIENLMFYKKK